MITNLSPRSPTRFSTLIARIGFSDASGLRARHRTRTTITTIRICTISARSAQSARVNTAIVNISALMDAWKYSSFSHCVSNVDLFSLNVKHALRCLLLRPSRTGARPCSHPSLGSLVDHLIFFVVKELLVALELLRLSVRHSTTDSCTPNSWYQRSAAMCA